MKEENKIVKDFKKKVNNLKKHNIYYFNKDNPIISDAEYDTLKQEILNLEKKYSFLRKLNLIKNLVGSFPSNKFKKIKHLKPMLSLSNAFNIDDMKSFISKINNFLKTNKQIQDFNCEPKIDGISATLIYKNGNLIRGLSRGDGITGEDILENIKTIVDLPKKIISKNIPNLLEIRCEIYIGKKDF